LCTSSAIIVIIIIIIIIIKCILLALALRADRNVVKRKQKIDEKEAFMCRDTTNVEHEMFNIPVKNGATGIVQGAGEYEL
jgi:hypothetical protein